jgi:hypothetical protein
MSVAICAGMMIERLSIPHASQFRFTLDLIHQ